MAKIFRLSWACFCLLLFLSHTNQAQDKILQKGYYLVAAAFLESQQDFAERYATTLNKEGHHSKIGFDNIRKFFYVYLDTYTTFNESINHMLKVRGEGKFEKAWIRIIKDNTNASVAQKESNAIGEEKKSENAKIVVNEKKQAQNTINPNEPEQKVAEEKKEVVPVTEVIPNPPAKPVYEPQTLRNTQVFLSLYNATNNEVLDGEIDVVDAASAQLIKRVKGNQYITLPNPQNQTGDLLLISEVFGFRKEENLINYKNTEADTLKPYVQLVGNYYMINFGLSKIHKGDISTLYNVYFFNDAAIMLPTSQYQLNSLLQLMKENPTYKIMLHGHTNGGGGGKIIYMGPSKNFFAVTKDVEQGAGSAKELSKARAKVIKDWLLTQGIEQSRIGVKGWGGSRMIHDKNSVHARKNIRVDVEVVDE